jgi:hypothetical protein
VWTKACGQVTAASLAIWPRPPLGPRGGGAAVAVLDTYLPTLLKKIFLSVLEMWRSPEKIFELISPNHLHPFINLT